MKNNFPDRLGYTDRTLYDVFQPVADPMDACVLLSVGALCAQLTQRVILDDFEQNGNRAEYIRLLKANNYFRVYEEIVFSS